jgi:hypothetical protein
MAIDVTTIGDTAVALAAALFGGAGVKILDKMLSKRNEYFVESSKIREELKAENASVKKERDEALEEVDAWRAKYWTQMEESIRHVAAIEALQHEVSTLKGVRSAQLPTSGSVR